jgi:hypothetical protein
VVEGARLESVYRGDSIVGSNPTVSARTSFVGIRRRPVGLMRDGLGNYDFALVVSAIVSAGILAPFMRMPPERFRALDRCNQMKLAKAVNSSSSDCAIMSPRLNRLVHF